MTKDLYKRITEKRKSKKKKNTIIIIQKKGNNYQLNKRHSIGNKPKK